MMLRQGSWSSRILAVAILVFLLLLGYRLLFNPLLDHYTANEQRIHQSSYLLQRYRELDGQKPSLADRLSALEEREDSANGYWQARSAAMTATLLQDQASRSVETHGGDVVSMQALDLDDGEVDQERARTTLRMRLNTTMRGLAEAIYDIETTVPYLFIDQLIVTPERSRTGRIGNAEADAKEPRLDVRLDVFGYALTKSPSLNEGEDADG